MCREGRYSFFWIVPLSHDPYLTMLSVKQGGIKYHFWVFGMTWPGIEIRSSWPLASIYTRKQKLEEKQMYGYFKQQKSEISLEKTRTWLRKGITWRETESLLNNAISLNYVKAKIPKTQQNSKCRLCGDRDETINHIIIECSKSTQNEYKIRHDRGWEGDLLGIVQEIEIWPYEQMVFAQPRIRFLFWRMRCTKSFFFILR